jgi:hypothetical protein
MFWLNKKNFIHLSRKKIRTNFEKIYVIFHCLKISKEKISFRWDDSQSANIWNKSQVSQKNRLNLESQYLKVLHIASHRYLKTKNNLKFWDVCSFSICFPNNKFHSKYSFDFSSFFTSFNTFSKDNIQRTTELILIKFDINFSTKR